MSDGFGGNGRWQINAGDLQLAYEAGADGATLLSGLRVAGREWAGGPLPPWAFPAAVDFVWEAVAGSAGDDGPTLSGRLTETGLTLAVSWQPDAEASVLLATPALTNPGDEPVTIPALTSFRLAAPVMAGSTLSVMTGGTWDASLPPGGYRLRTYRLEDIRSPLAIGAAEDGRSTGDDVPWFCLTDGETGLAVSLLWSGRWQCRATRAGDQVVVEIGLADFAHTLAPGETLELPPVALYGFQGDLDAATNAWRAWVTRTLAPAQPEDWPWVQYNHWYAYDGDIDERRLLDEARHAASAGCEVFVIDDGWFVGRQPDSYIRGWGDWREDRAKFPDGLRAFGEQVRALGLRFGLWVEPERAAQMSPVARDHPDWLVQRDGQPMTWRYGDDLGVHLCLGVPAAQEWMATEMIRVVREYGVAWLKWDYNIGYGLGCDCPDHGHQAGDGHYAHTLGLYRVLARLREACPELVIENCASGGHRADLGLVRYTDTNWLSDYTHQAASCRQHAQGAGYVLPIAHLNTWTLEQRTLTEFRSRMGGAFGVSSRLGAWSNADRQALATAIAEYKRLRPLLGGKRYLLSGPLHQQWDIWQFVSPDRRSFAVLAFREDGQISDVTVQLRGLLPEDRYHLEQEREPCACSGAELMSAGLPLRCADDEGSTVIWGTYISDDLKMPDQPQATATP